jgi:hypothetical protein
MILLSNTASVLQIITGGPQVVAAHASWLDANGTNIAISGKNTQSSSAGTTVICPSPPVSTQRNIEFVSICNTDPTNPVNVTVEHTDGTTVSIFQQTFSLPAGATIFYEDQRGWYMLVSGTEAYASPP